ncbi:hypothetical protein DH2020_027432 [Rehmannia glutinosa]|uniref:Protein GIGANTEA-like n=1 Tax=Rehmannia glutinosa TaxID=99300 RepID=A0ABR0VW18_REHGL
MGSTFYVGEKMGVSHIDYYDSDEISLLEIISMANELGLKGFTCFHVNKGGVNNCMDILAIHNNNDAMKLVDFIDQNRMVGVFVEYEPANVHVSKPMNENVTTQDLPNIEEPLPYWGDMDNSDMGNDHMDNIDEHQGNEVDIEEHEGNENVHGIENDEVSDSDFEQSVGSDSEFSDEFVDSECEFSDEDDRMFDDHIDNEVEWGGLEMNKKNEGSSSQLPRSGEEQDTVQVKTYVGKHKCPRVQKMSHVTPRWLAKTYKDKRLTDPRGPIESMMVIMQKDVKLWIDSLQFSSLFSPPPQDAEQRKAQITAYVEYFGQFTSEQFPDDIAELIRSRYPSKENRLFDDVLATFVLHHPEHGHTVILPIISCIIDGTIEYDRSGPPFASFISLVCPNSENEYSEQWALACGEILRILTHYNRPIYKFERQENEAYRSSSGNHASTSKSADGQPSSYPTQPERKPMRPLSPWITDILLAAPLGIRSDYFRWCGGVMGKYAAGELKPPLIASSRGSGKHPQLMPSTPRWAVANGAGVILSVCDEEVARYETATLTAAAVPALLLPPPTTPMDEHLVAGLPALEPYARLFHRYYAIASPSATQRLLLGLLEAPPSWAPDALDAAVQLVELLRAAEDYASGMRLPRNWMHLHFLRAIGIAMSMRAGIAADSAAALLFRILSQPALLFPPLRQVDGIEVQHEPLGGYISSQRKQQRELPAAEATVEATAQGIASMLCAHGPEVEWRICTIWEAAYGLIPLSSSAVDLPDIIVATPLQPPLLSWNLYIPLLKVLEYLPRGSPSETCLMKIFVATVEAILQRTFPAESSREQIRKTRYIFGSASKNLAVAELRTMPIGSKRPKGESSYSEELGDVQSANGKRREMESKQGKKQGPVAAFDSYVIAAVCALSCELQLFPLISKGSGRLDARNIGDVTNPAKVHDFSSELQNGVDSAVYHTRRILAILEALFSLKPSSIGTSWSYSSNEIVAAAMVAAHVSDLFRHSRACMRALSILIKCKWDNEIHSRASSLFNLIDIHSKVVASIVNKAEPLEAHILHAPLSKEIPSCFHGKKHNTCASCRHVEAAQPSSLSCENLSGCEALVNYGKADSSEVERCTMGKGIASFPADASDLANFLTMDRHIGFNCSAQVLLRSVLAEKQELCFSVVSLLWHKLIVSPETQPSAESTSAQQGWRQVVAALCNVVSASPAKAATAVVLQAERELKPWIAKDDDLGQRMWRVNQRIVKVIVELMRNHEAPESLVILASASDVLLRATDGMLLLEVTARAVQPVLGWGESGLAVADGLSNLLKCRLPATVRCVSHPSAHVRALSTSVLRAILHAGSIKSKSKQVDAKGIHSPRYQYLNVGITDWQADIEKCLTWEAHSRRATGLPTQFVHTAAKELGYPLERKERLPTPFEVQEVRDTRRALAYVDYTHQRRGLVGHSERACQKRKNDLEGDSFKDGEFGEWLQDIDTGNFRAGPNGVRSQFPFRQRDQNLAKDSVQEANVLQGTLKLNNEATSSRK